MAIKTRAALLRGDRDITLAERELTVGPDEVLVKTYQASICGSDKGYYLGDRPEGTKLPFWIGHEGGGTVVEVGSRVHEFKPGDLVMAFNWCNTMADYFKAPVWGLELAPEGLPPYLASLGEPVSCGILCAMQAGVELGDTVAILGTGFAGLIIVQCVKRMGASKVIAVDLVDDKLQMAKIMGADYVVNPQREDVLDRVMEITHGKGVDIAVECAGTEQTMNQATAILRKNGRLMLYSWIRHPITLNISRWHDDGLEIRTAGMVHHGIDQRRIWVRQAMKPLLAGVVDVKPLLTHEFRLADIAAAFETAANDPKAIKVVIKP